MKKGLTELVFILDRSGSMSGLEKDTIGGYNSLLKKQKKEPGEATITTVLFDDHYELLHDRINLKGISPITDKEYFVRGSTALLDAIGRTIDKIGNAQKHTAEDERAEKVMFVITTDGMENASREYRYDKIKAMIEHQKEKYRWEFLCSSVRTSTPWPPQASSEFLPIAPPTTTPTAEVQELYMTLYPKPYAVCERHPPHRFPLIGKRK